MTGEQAKAYMLQLNTEKAFNATEHEAIRCAIKSLEAWDKVKEELTDKATFDNVDDLVLCMRIIDKHLKEVES
jgi:hypothetical protein